MSSRYNVLMAIVCVSHVINTKLRVTDREGWKRSRCRSRD